MNNLINLPGCQELTAQEKETINGGGWAWPAVLAAGVFHFVKEAFQNTPDLPTAGEYK